MPLTATSFLLFYGVLHTYPYLSFFHGEFGDSNPWNLWLFSRSPPLSCKVLSIVVRINKLQTGFAPSKVSMRCVSHWPKKKKNSLCGSRHQPWQHQTSYLTPNELIVHFIPYRPLGIQKLKQTSYARPPPL
ncbi:uncharacterized protein CCOS01_02341 [Colletotrichum costaricense]|uniref:Secreted protein n=1 Tax=Colletotrichum costaricense TaxID=1209916 RepID=A0AAI9Z7U1_9PEZI|nr:uncharacterized protein CCOS01_02341 [Colletotrichum costaricense]KAK1537021.1 hypothetical protein CCOS01_02341 [Colletotrichum costaricense]